MPDTRHKQKWVVVNALVDSEIAPFIEALNSWWGVATFESCQGDPVEAYPKSHVSIHLSCGNWPRAVAYLKNFINPFLGRPASNHSRVGDGAELCATGGSDPTIHLLLCRESAEDLMEFLAEHRTTWEGEWGEERHRTEE